MPILKLASIESARCHKLKVSDKKKGNHMKPNQPYQQQAEREGCHNKEKENQGYCYLDLRNLMIGDGNSS